MGRSKSLHALPSTYRKKTSIPILQASPSASTNKLIKSNSNPISASTNIFHQNIFNELFRSAKGHLIDKKSFEETLTGADVEYNDDDNDEEKGGSDDDDDEEEEDGDDDDDDEEEDDGDVE